LSHACTSAILTRMQAGRKGDVFYVRFQQPRREDFGVLGLVVRFVINVAALWVAQALVTGFDIDSWPALLLGAVIFGGINAFVKPIVSFISCPLTCLTLGFFLLIINAAMLALTGWIAGWFDMAFEVDGFWAAFLGALVIAVISAILTVLADAMILKPSRPDYYEDRY
jgi:putative membrane protein